MTSPNSQPLTLNNGHDPAASIRYALQMERAAQIEASGRERKIVFAGKWGSEPGRLFDALTNSRWSRRPQTPFDRLMGRLVTPKIGGIARSLLTVRAVRAPLSADFIYFRNNIRLFYGAENLTLKCKNPLASASQNLITNEIEVRNRLSPSRHIKVPPMAAAHTGDDGYILEQLLTDATVYPPTGDVEQLAAGLLELYAVNGLRPMAMSQAVDLSELMSSVERAGDLVGVDGASIARQLNTLFSQVRADEVQLPFGLCHGDLASVNIMLDGDTIYLIDWERAGDDFIARDLAKLFHQLKNIRQPLTSHILAWQAARGGQWVRWHHQVILGHMASIDRHLNDLERPSGNSFERKRSRKSLQLSANRLLADLQIGAAEALI